jgi:hypothetical protein
VGWDSGENRRKKILTLDAGLLLYLEYWVVKSRNKETVIKPKPERKLRLMAFFSSLWATIDRK